MASYSLSGDEFFGGKNIFQKTGSFLKKEAKAASKTIARFDPTAKTAKYGNITKGIGAGLALGAAAILTGGGALAVAGGMATATSTGMGIAAKPVRKPVKGISPAIIPGISLPGVPASGVFTPINSFTDTAAAPSVRPADSAITALYATSAKSRNTSSLVVIGCVVAAGVALALFSMKG